MFSHQPDLQAAKPTRRPKPRHLAEDFEFDFDYTGGTARQPARQRRPPDKAEDAEPAAALPEQVGRSGRSPCPHDTVPELAPVQIQLQSLGSGGLPTRQKMQSP